MRTDSRVLLLIAAAALVMAATASIGAAHPVEEGEGKSAGFDLIAEEVSPGGVPMERMSHLRCVRGMAGIFPCDDVDLMSFVPLQELESIWANDVWGWTDPLNGNEYALVSTYEGVAFVDVSTPANPTYLGTMPSEVPGDFGNIWGDIKTYGNAMYHVTESPFHGMQVFDLTRLRGVTSPQAWSPDNVVTGFGNVHNLAVNEDTAHAVIVGATGDDVTACDNGGGGPMFYDLSDPLNPAFAGCFADDGYTHDVQCVIYIGPDAVHQGKQICIAANEDTLTVLDATDPASVIMVSRTEYDTSGYTHQGWFNDDQTHFLLSDELDELSGNVPARTTYVWDLTDLDAPVLLNEFNDGSLSIDHNIFIKDDLAHQSNYTSGYWIYDTLKVEDGLLKARAYFDVYPATDGPIFAGTWGNYPFFDSGTVIVTGIEEGLFVLRPGVSQSGYLGD